MSAAGFFDDYDDNDFTEADAEAEEVEHAMEGETTEDDAGDGFLTEPDMESLVNSFGGVAIAAAGEASFPPNGCSGGQPLISHAVHSIALERF